MKLRPIVQRTTKTLAKNATKTKAFPMFGRRPRKQAALTIPSTMATPTARPIGISWPGGPSSNAKIQISKADARTGTTQKMRIMVDNLPATVGELHSTMESWPTLSDVTVGTADIRIRWRLFPRILRLSVAL